jgi:hypothetical protein
LGTGKSHLLGALTKNWYSRRRRRRRREENVTSGTLSAEGGAHGNGRAPYVQYSHAYVGPRAESASAAVTNGGAASGLALQEHDDDDDFV